MIFGVIFYPGFVTRKEDAISSKVVIRVKFHQYYIFNTKSDILRPALSLVNVQSGDPIPLSR